MRGRCRLCGILAELEQGHIVPAFVGRWLKDSSATGYLRHGMTMNRRVQDTEKEYWLCGVCEDRFQKWEKLFAEHVFMPLNKGEAARFSYGSWMLKFAVSVSRRSLNLLREMERLSHFTAPLLEDVDLALQTWSEYLLDRRPHPGRFEQHMLLLDSVGKYFFESTAEHQSIPLEEYRN